MDYASALDLCASSSIDADATTRILLSFSFPHYAMVRKQRIAIELVGLNKLVHLKMAPPTQSTTSDASSSTASSGDGKPPTQSTTSDASASLASPLKMRPKDTIADVKATIAKQLDYSGELSWKRNPLPDAMTGQALNRAMELLEPMFCVVDKIDLLNGVVEEAEANDDDDDSD